MRTKAPYIRAAADECHWINPRRSLLCAKSEDRVRKDRIFREFRNGLNIFKGEKLMKTKKTLKTFSLSAVILVLIAAMALCMTACNETKGGASSTPALAVTDTVKEIGEGGTQFSLTVTDGEGNTQKYTVNTDEKTVGAALLNLGVIEGDDGPYGLYIKKVNGITADYDTDGTYWSFYVDGAYATKSADQTEITAGSEYSFKVEK